MSNDDLDYGALTSMEEGEIPTSYIKPNKVYKADEYFVTLTLSNLVNSILTEHDYDDGRPPQRGLFIPIRDAGLFVSPKKNVMVTCKMEMAQVVSKHHSHLLTQVVDHDVLAEWRRLGLKHEFIGFAKPISFKNNK